MPFTKILIFLLCAGVLSSVIFFIEPPKSWPEASLFQMTAFFIPFLFAVTILLDFFMKYLPHSFILSLGLILLLAFYFVNQLNYLTAILVILIVTFSLRVFPRMKLPRFRLTGGVKIPKLHMQKQEMPKIRRLRRLR